MGSLDDSLPDTGFKGDTFSTKGFCFIGVYCAWIVTAALMTSSALNANVSSTVLRVCDVAASFAISTT